MNFEQEDAFEEALRRALRRDSPAAGFAGRVHKRIGARRARRLTRYWMAVAAMLTVSVAAGTAVHDYEQHQQAEAAKAGEQLVTALKITTNKLHAAHKMIRRRTNAI